MIPGLDAPASDEHECRGEEQRPSPGELDKVEVEQVVRARHVVRRLGREVAHHAQHQGPDDVHAHLREGAQLEVYWLSGD